LVPNVPKHLEEVWKPIPEFPRYQISNLGRVYNQERDIIMQTSHTNFGHVKITLRSEHYGIRYTRSVAQLVAEAFVEPPNIHCDQIVILDGNFDNLAFYNIMWRPRWFAWKYTRQLKMIQPMHYKNLPIVNVVTHDSYESVIDAGMTEGLLFNDIWRSTYAHSVVYPTGVGFEVIK